MYKNEGNEYFREKDYGRAVVSYSEGLKKKCEDAELNAVLHTNRGAAHFHLGEGSGAAFPLCFPVLNLLFLRYSMINSLFVVKRCLEP